MLIYYMHKHNFPSVYFSLLLILVRLAHANLGQSYSQDKMSGNENDDVDVEFQVKVRRDGQTTQYKVQTIPNSHSDLTKSPHWDVETQNLYYVDFAGKLIRYAFNESRIYKATIPADGMPCFVLPIEGTTDKFAIGIARRVIIVTWDGVADNCTMDRTLFEVQTEERFKDNRLNIGKCDPRGRLFAGTMLAAGDEFLHRFGELYKYEGGNIQLIQGDIGIANGMAWDEKQRKFYFIDTGAYNMRAYDYDMETGTTSNPQVILDTHKTDTREHLLLPDGLTIDSDGNLYVTIFNAGTIFKYDPQNRKILLEIRLPCKLITSAVFGGPNLDILFVTTSSRFDEVKPAGSLFMVTGLGARGLPATKMRI